MLTEKGITKNKFVLQMDNSHTNTCIPIYSVRRKSSCLTVITIGNTKKIYKYKLVINNVIYGHEDSKEM